MPSFVGHLLQETEIFENFGGIIEGLSPLWTVLGSLQAKQGPSAHSETQMHVSFFFQRALYVLSLYLYACV